MQEFADTILEEIVQKYYDKKISKNTLKEEIIKFQGERTLIKKPFEKSVLKKETKILFIEKCTFLFNDLNLDIKQSFEDVIYDLRNLITHNFRLLTNKVEELNEIIFLFEIVILELLIGFNEKEKDQLEPIEIEQKEPEINSANIIISTPADSKKFKDILIKKWNKIILKLLINTST
jgi:hypothetical protein